jgi:tRNA threonylcarbamoyladenosine biosynthesis protein TsaB
MILGLDASGPSMAVGMVEGGRVLADWHWQRPRSAGSHLMAWVESLTQEFGVPQAIAVGVGPGSFTGVRIAVTGAKVLAWAWSIPVTGVSSLAAWAFSGPIGARVLVTSERRGSAFYGGYYFLGQNGPEAIMDDFPVDGVLPDRFPTGEAVAVIGALANDREWLQRVGPRAYGLDQVPLLGSAVARLGEARSSCDNPVSLSPSYLKNAQVAVNRDESQGAGFPGLEDSI